MRERTRALLARPAPAVSTRTPARSRCRRRTAQLLQVARALAFDCRILVLDEPTTALTDAEADHLFAVLERLTRARHDAALRVASAAGSVPAVRSHHGAARRRLRRHLRARRGDARRHRARDGRARSAAQRADQRPPARAARPALAVRGADSPAAVSKTSRSTVARAARSSACSGSSDRDGPSCSRRSSACTAPTRRRSRVDGRAVALPSARDAARAGIALVPEDRQRQGLFFNLTLRHNLVLPSRAMRRCAWSSTRARNVAQAAALLSDWRIKAPGAGRPPDSAERRQSAEGRARASGWRPTRACCCSTSRPRAWTSAPNSRSTSIIRRQAAEGSACLVVSSDLPEVLALADRIARHARRPPAGRARGRPRPTEEAVMHLAHGTELAQKDAS